MKDNIKIIYIIFLSCFLAFILVYCDHTTISKPEKFSKNNRVVKPKDSPKSKYVDFALFTSNYLVNQQNADGAIPDVANGETVNMDSNMEYALIGIAAAYEYSKDPHHLSALEKGIHWLAARQEMSNPKWRGSWFYAYSSAPPYNPQPTSPDDPAILDVRGVDATSALFVYLLYLHSAFSGSNTLVQAYAANGRAALDFLLTHNQSPDGFFYSSWHKWASDGRWHLWRFRYTADQADVYLGMQSGWNLFNDTRYRDVATHLQKKTPVTFFDAAQGRYAIGIELDGSFESELLDFNSIFPQGYLPWVFGFHENNQRALNWLTSCVQIDGSIRCYPNDPRFSLSIAIYAMANISLGKALPTSSLDWLLANTFDGQDGGIHDTLDPTSEKFPNVAGFAVVAFLEFLPFPSRVESFRKYDEILP